MRKTLVNAYHKAVARWYRAYFVGDITWVEWYDKQDAIERVYQFRLLQLKSVGL